MSGSVKWTVRLEVMDDDGKPLAAPDLITIVRDLDRVDGSAFGLKLSEGKAVLEQIQSRITQRQVDQVAMKDRSCRSCGAQRSIHDYRSRKIQTLFGKVTIRAPRFRACRCKMGPQKNEIGSEIERLIPCRTTPEFNHVLAELGARHSFREAARIMNMFVPARGMHNHTGVRSRLAKVADRIEARDRQAPYRMNRSTNGPVSVFIDGTYVRAVPGYQTRHFEVVMGRVERSSRPPAHFASMPNVSSSRHEIVRAAMKAQGWVPGRDVVVFSDGDPSLAETVRRATNGSVQHILDWFHASMRIQHLRECCRSLVETDQTGELEFKCAAAHLEHMRSLLWRGKVTTARWLLRAAAGDLRRIDPRAHPRAIVQKTDRLVLMIIEFDKYLDLNQGAMPNYAGRSRKGLPVSSSRAESSANALVNRRMNKRRQMCWSPRGAQRVLHARVAVLDGRLRDGCLKLTA